MKTTAVTPSGSASGPVPNSAELSDRLMSAARRFRRASAATLAPLGLTPAQERALRLVARSDGAVRMGELPDRMGIVPRSATSLVAALEEEGLALRAIDPDNRRSILVTLTERGRAVQQDMANARRDAVDQLFSRLSADERQQLGALLDKILGEP